VIAPASTGNDSSKRNAVIRTAHTNNGNMCIVIPSDLMLIAVTMKLIAPRIDDIPAK